MANQPDLEAISAAASNAQASLAAVPDDDRLLILEKRLADLEVYQEDFAKRDTAYADFSEYVKDLRSDLRDVRRARTVYGGAALLVVGFLLVVLVELVFDVNSPIRRLPQYPAAALLIGILTGAVIILLALAKSAHRLPAEKQSEEANLPQIELLSQLLKSIKS